ncbi:MAG: hypothetical protein WA958_16060 [Tunicatimonas sp.]
MTNVISLSLLLNQRAALALCCCSTLVACISREDQLAVTSSIRSATPNVWFTDISDYVHNFADAPRLDVSAQRDTRLTDVRGQNESLQGEPSSRYVPFDALEKSDVFQVAVAGEEVFVAREECFGDSVFHTSQFFVDGPTEITIISATPITTYAIRPYHKEIAGTVEGNTLTFRVAQPEMLMVTVNDYQPLCLFQTPPETDVPDRADSNVVYFPAGTHEVGVLRPKSGQTIYLEPGAWLKGRVYADGVNDVTIRGRGVIDARGFTSKPEKICGLEFKNSQGIRVEGIGLRTGEWWQSLFLLCQDVEVTHMNLMSFGLNNDGIDIDGVTNFRASRNFIGCGDDGFGWHAVDAEANGQPPTRNCRAEDCVIYNAHAGNGLRVGASMETELFEDITFRNITVLAHANAGIRSDHSDWALVKNLRFENFYIELPGRPIEIRVEKTRYSNSTGFRDERGRIDGLHFENVIAAGGKIILEGFSEEHLIEDVHFVDSYNSDEKISGPKDIATNKFVKNVSFQ